MAPALTIAGKDLRQRLRDRSAIIVAVVAPLGLALIFSSVFGGESGLRLDLHLGVVDEDGGELAAAFADGVLTALADQGDATVDPAGPRAEVLAAVEDGTLDAAFVIPEGFSAAVQAGGDATIEVVGNTDADIGTAVAEAVARSFAADLRAVQVAVGTVAGAGTPEPATVQRLAEAVRASPPPIAIGRVQAERRELDAPTYLSAGMAVFFLFFTVQFGVTSLLEERREGTLQRLFAAPIARSSVYVGKAVTSLVLGVASMTVLDRRVRPRHRGDLGRSGRGGAARPRRRRRRHRGHGAHRHPGPHRRTGQRVAVGRCRGDGDAGRDLLPHRGPVRGAGLGQPAHPAPLVPPRDGRPRRRRDDRGRAAGGRGAPRLRARRRRSGGVARADGSGPMRSVLTIALNDVRRLLRDRSSLFFVFVLPMLLVLLIGMQFGGSFRPELAVHLPADAGPLADELVAAVEAGDAFDVTRVEDAEAVATAVSRGEAAAGLDVPADYDAGLREGRDVEVGYVARQDGAGFALQATVQAAVAEQAAEVEAARLAVSETGATFDDALDRARQVSTALPAVDVDVSRVGASLFEDFDQLGQYDLGASSQLLLFVFLTSLTGSAGLIQTRQWGITRRVLSTPTRAGQALAGAVLGRFVIALVQALYILVGTVVLFGVSWGDPIGAGAVIVVFCLVSAGAGMLIGAIVDNDAQAGGLGILVGLGLAALGGSMAPMEVFSDTMRRVAHLVSPHAWANDAFAELVRRGGGVGDILPELGVLVAVAVALIALGSWRLQKVTTGSS